MRLKSSFLLSFLLAFALPGLSAASPAICSQWLPRLPNVSKPLCEAAQLVDSGARSVQGRPIWVRDIVPAREQLRIMVVGGIHGDEVSATSLVFHWIAQAERERAALDPASAGTLWRFIPSLNPDGLLARRPSRVNARGVDLNRNFPTPNWDQETKIYWEKRVRKDPRRWPGPRALSEPESRFLHDDMERFKPDLVVSVHAPYGVLDFDGPQMPPTRLGRLYLDQVGIFPGSLGNYSGVHKGVPVVTIELANAVRTPRNAEMRQMWVQLQQWTQRTFNSSVPSTLMTPSSHGAGNSQ